MHHYRSREDETSCGGTGPDPYFYLRLSSAGAAPASQYCGGGGDNQPAAIKLEVDVKPEPRMMTPVPCGLQLQQASSPSSAAVMDAGIVVQCKQEIQQPPLSEIHHHHDGSTTTAAGIGLLALTQLDGYGGSSVYKSAFRDNVMDVHHGEAPSTLLQMSSAVAADLLHRDKDDKYLFGRQLMYASTDDDIKVHTPFANSYFLFSNVVPMKSKFTFFSIAKHCSARIQNNYRRITLLSYIRSDFP